MLEHQEFWGFTYVSIDLVSCFFIAICLIFTSLLTPLKIDKPSNIIIYTIYILVIIPTLTLTLGLREDSLKEYGIGLFCLVIGYIFLSFVTFLNVNKNPSSYSFPSINVKYFFLFFWFFCFFGLLFLFKDVINFVGLDNIYEQRAAGKSRNLFEGYMQSYFPNVICAALMAYGLYEKKFSYIFISGIGYVLMFGINAQRTVFLMPLILSLLYFYLKNNNYNKATLIKFNLCLSLILLILALIPNGFLRDFLGFYLATRVIATPGIMFSLYHDVFSQTSYTYWAHVKGVNLIVDKPYIFSNDSDWPQLGYIVAKYKLGIISNSNANIFAADGVAAAGGIGIILISIIFAFYLYFLDFFSKNIDPRFKVLVAFPIGLALTNGSLATVLLTFGGIFWLLFYFFVSNRNS
ncbi:O-antigen polysaccharide polymerase Wzy [Acinetobacter towneri]|uniref:O-antigen polysaccharide polymerase Wzy n=1 Tax=Acinetobacter towneri TaxID=202956 RepID=UPI002097A3DB|nr:O-antigen polysaccharide polymerase Wzy [Acinetobacter towneri]MCO8058837.1 O-antigen polysaccharide polymerase Wzy [Acinetobacter towneri]MCO8064681.1 O-antigen polysaccharide polymerase Wzy [Acinetobacter towneri]